MPQGTTYRQPLAFYEAQYKLHLDGLGLPPNYCDRCQACLSEPDTYSIPQAGGKHCKVCTGLREPRP